MRGKFFLKGESEMWNDISELKSLSNWFQWISISLVFLSGFLQIGKYVVDRREKELSTIEQAKVLNPTLKPIHSGTATIEVIIQSGDVVNGHFIDLGAAMAFVKGSELLMTMRSIDSFGKSNSNGQIKYRAVVNLDASDPSNGKPVNFLKEADRLELLIGPIKDNSKLVSGNVVITINSAVRLESPIPPQQINGKVIIVPDLTSMLANL